MTELVPAAVELRCYLNVLLCGPNDLLARQPTRFIDDARVVAIVGFRLAGPDEHCAPSAIEVTNAAALAIAQHEGLFHTLFEE